MTRPTTTVCVWRHVDVQCGFHLARRVSQITMCLPTIKKIEYTDLKTVCIFKGKITYYYYYYY